jgi:hypothetical protein
MEQLREMVKIGLMNSQKHPKTSRRLNGPARAFQLFGFLDPDAVNR